MDSPATLQSAWLIIKANPWVFISILASTFVGGFFTAKLFYESVYKLAKERLEAARDELGKLEKINADLKKDAEQVSSGVTNQASVVSFEPVSTKISSITSVTPSPKLSTTTKHQIVSYFNKQSFSDIKSVISASKTTNRPALIIIFDPNHPTGSKLNYSLGYFMEYNTTKNIVDEYFVTAVVPWSDPDTKALVPADDPLENCRLVVLSPSGQVLRSEGVYANPDEGLKRVRSIISELG